MTRLIGLLIITAGVVASCQTTAPADSLPECDPNKVYAQPVPSVCKKPVPTPLACPKTKLVGEPFNTMDTANLRVALYRCAELFPVSPCLKVFSKVEDRKYRAICGAPDSSGRQEVLDWTFREKKKNAK